MSNLVFFIDILAMSIGVIAIIITVRQYQIYRFKYLLLFSYNLILFNVISILYLPVIYLFQVLNENIYSFENLTLIIIYLTTINVAKYLWCYTYILWINCLLDKTIPRTFKAIFFIISVATIFVFIMMFFFTSIEKNIRLIQYVDKIVIYQTTLTNYFALIGLYRKKRFLDIGKAAAIKLYSLPIIIIGGCVFLIDIIGLFRNVIYLRTISISLILFSSNLVPLLVIKRFTRKFGSTKNTNQKHFTHLEEMMKTYNISNREKEIITLICNGNSNRQIADQLFISIYTVKDHIHNIFQKTNVKNRVQLANLFR